MKLTPPQKVIFLRVLAAGAAAWCRAQSSGERVTFASLYRRGLFERQAWRGNEGERDAAHEYRVPAFVRAELTRLTNVTEAQETFSRIFDRYAASHRVSSARSSQKEQA